MAQIIQTQVGEGFVGSGPNAAHLNTALGSKGGPIETAWATALATPRAGHIPFVVVLRPNLPVKPLTLFVNKADIRGEQHETLTWGAAQAGVASGVAAAVGMASFRLIRWIRCCSSRRYGSIGKPTTPRKFLKITWRRHAKRWLRAQNVYQIFKKSSSNATTRQTRSLLNDTT
jgi:hypothetical protein